MKISFSGTLLRFVDYQKTIELEANTVRDAITKISEKYPQSYDVLYDGDLRIKKVHQIFLNGKRILHNEIDKTLNTNDNVDIITAIAGG